MPSRADIEHLLRRTEYIPGSGFEGDADVVEDVPVVRRIEKTLRDGVPVLVFPEGTRSKERSLQKFTRGAIEAAIRRSSPCICNTALVTSVATWSSS